MPGNRMQGGAGKAPPRLEAVAPGGAAIAGMDQPGIIDWPSPNHGPRRDGARPSLVVIHYTAMHSAEAARDLLCTPEAQVSAHYLVGRDGRAWQLVPEARRAWHAGAGRWGGTTDVNSHSIGIELDNDGFQPFAEPLMARLEALLGGILARHGIGPAGVIGHSDCAPGRKIDPGRRFDWARLGRRGLALRVPPGLGQAGPGSDSDFRAAMARAGWTASEDPALLLEVLRHRFRPWARGPREGRDMALAAWLAREHPAGRMAAPGARAIDGAAPTA